MYPFKVLNKKKYALCFLNAFIENMCLYIMPVVLSIYLTISFDLDKFKMLIILTIIIKIVEIFANVLWNTLAEPFLDTSKKDLQISYFKRICNMNISKINSIHTGYLKKQLDIICDETTNLLDGLMMTVNGFGIAITIFLIQVYKQSSSMFIICLISTIFIVIYNVIITKTNVKIQEEYNDKNAKYNATAVDFLQNVKIVKNFEAKEYATDTMENKFKIVKKPMIKTHIFRSMRSDGINFMVYFMYVIVLLNLFFKMKNGDTNIFSYLVFYTSMFSGLNTELRDVARLFIIFNKFKSANNQIEKMIIDEDQTNKIRTWNNITLKNIEFKYKGESNIINIPYFSLDKNDKISIVGESGQGKSTFLSLFSRFYEVNDNNYLVDFTPTSKAPDIAYISQETDLFDLSIRDNLLLGKKLSDDKLNEYLEDAGLLEWINELHKGLDSQVGEKGIKLSAGQKQRLNIIRGILLDKDIYILDEPTSNLDIVSENKIYDMIDKYLKDKTCIIVTHRPKLTEMCNKHYYFRNKTLIEKK